MGVKRPPFVEKRLICKAVAFVLTFHTTVDWSDWNFCQRVMMPAPVPQKSNVVAFPLANSPSSRGCDAMEGSLLAAVLLKPIPKRPGVHAGVAIATSTIE